MKNGMRTVLLVLAILSLPQPVFADRPQPANSKVQVVQRGEYGQVSTIAGNGAQAQTPISADNPRKIDIDSRGRIWFIDGSQKTAKLRYVEKGKMHTAVDLVRAKANYKGYFLNTGLCIVKDRIFVSELTAVYEVLNGRITNLDPKIGEYIKNKGYQNILRMERYDGDLYLMLATSSSQYSIVKYNLQNKTITEILPKTHYLQPYNFYVDSLGILICDKTGALYYENLNPRYTASAVETQAGPIVDAWFDEHDNLYYVLWRNQSYAEIYMIPEGESGEGLGVLVAGSVRGYQDGIKDEVQMDWPTDFVWDGSGFLFGDMGNHAIRKLWLPAKPTNAK